jgi:hypothetical protein
VRFQSLKIVLFAFLLLALVTVPVRAATIDFSTPPYPIPTVITTQFSGLGVLFSVETATPAPSFPGPIIDSLLSTGLYNTFNYNIPIRATFTTPVNLVGFTSVAGLAALHVWAYNAGGTLLGDVSIGPSSSGQIFSPTNIAYISMFNDSGTGTRPDLTGVQTLSFQPIQPIPEPATLLLLGSGLAAAGMRRRMKKRR